MERTENDDSNDFEEVNDFSEIKSILEAFTPEDDEALICLKSKLVKVIQMQKDAGNVSKWYGTLYDELEEISTFMVNLEKRPFAPSRVQEEAWHILFEINNILEKFEQNIHPKDDESEEGYYNENFVGKYVLIW